MTPKTSLRHVVGGNNYCICTWMCRNCRMPIANPWHMDVFLLWLMSFALIGVNCFLCRRVLCFVPAEDWLPNRLVQQLFSSCAFKLLSLSLYFITVFETLQTLIEQLTLVTNSLHVDCGTKISVLVGRLVMPVEVADLIDVELVISLWSGSNFKVLELQFRQLASTTKWRPCVQPYL